MAKVTVAELTASLEQLQAQMAELSKRLESVEQGGAGTDGAQAAAVTPAPAAVAAPASPAAVAAPASPAAAPSITEEELLAISAAIGAYLGVRAHIRQIRLLSTTAWAQQGRVSIQASHRLG